MELFDLPAVPLPYELAIQVHKKEYHVLRGQTPSANAFLKVIIRESHLDTNATKSTFQTKLSSLDEYLPTIGNDITKFNQYVLLMVAALAARGEKTKDLLTNLFKGYKAAADVKFVDYIARKQERHEEGEDMTYSVLMHAANKKFKTLKEKGEWNTPS